MSIFNEEQIKAMKNMRTYTQPEKKYWALQMMIPRKIQTIKNIS